MHRLFLQFFGVVPEWPSPIDVGAIERLHDTDRYGDRRLAVSICGRFDVSTLLEILVRQEYGQAGIPIESGKPFFIGELRRYRLRTCIE